MAKTKGYEAKQCRAFRQHSCRVAIIAMAYRNCDTFDVYFFAATDGAMFRFSTQRGGSTKRTTHSALFVFIVRLRICSSIGTYKAQVLIQRVTLVSGFSVSCKGR